MLEFTPGEFKKQTPSPFGEYPEGHKRGGVREYKAKNARIFTPSPSPGGRVDLCNFRYV